MSQSIKKQTKRKSVVVSTLLEVISKLEEITTACETSDIKDKKLINNL